MKKLILFIAILFCKNAIQAQSLGVSASLLAFMPKYAPESYFDNSQVHDLGNNSMFTPGIRIEANYILPGFNFPVTGYNGLGFTYFLPALDSTVFDANFVNGATMNNIASTRIVNHSVFELRFGYEIPQTFNDFLMIHFGLGMGFSRFKCTNLLPEKTADFPFDISDFEPSTFTPEKFGGMNLEPMVGVVYEFEKFSLMGQYSLLFAFVGGQNSPYGYKHGLSLGVYVPLKRF